MLPITFAPYLRPQVWGDFRLAKSLGKCLPTPLTYGESWEISGHPLHVSHVADGQLQGKSLSELWSDYLQEMTGKTTAADAVFPLLIKYLDCNAPLSVQVHPDDATAVRLLGEPRGKSECWIVIAADPEARMYAGFKRPVTREEFEAALKLPAHDPQGLLSLLHMNTPRPGDCLNIPAGIVHAVAGGVLFAEVQQTSDATFRIYDWDRPGLDGKPRELHLAQALESIDWSQGPVTPVTPEVLSSSAKGSVELLVDSPYFRVERLQGAIDYSKLLNTELTIWMVLAGQVKLHASDMASPMEHIYAQGETVLIPAGCHRYSWSSDDALLLKVSIP
jgi:mannose-6-phosphate isomerase